MKSAIDYLLDKCYFTFGSSCFHQLIGIAIGSDLAPFMAGLFLHYYERKWFLQTKSKVRIFSNFLRFIDDLCTFNNNKFENSYNDIYPNKLKFKKENENPCKALFLDLSIEFHDRKVTTELLNKRDAFSFYINCKPYFDSNILSKIFYASIGSEILHIAKTATDLINMIKRVNFSSIRLKIQGSECSLITSLLEKIFEKHFQVFHKFEDTADTVCDLFVCVYVVMHL